MSKTMMARLARIEAVRTAPVGDDEEDRQRAAPMIARLEARIAADEAAGSDAPPLGPAARREFHEAVEEMMLDEIKARRLKAA